MHKLELDLSRLIMLVFLEQFGELDALFKLLMSLIDNDSEVLKGASARLEFILVNLQVGIGIY